jgi:hypothetical protein
LGPTAYPLWYPFCMTQKPNATQRVNVNLPADVRLRLRALAKQSQMRDGELARELLLDALVVREKAAAKLALTKVYTEERRRRDIHIAECLEKLRA